MDWQGITLSASRDGTDSFELSGDAEVLRADATPHRPHTSRLAIEHGAVLYTTDRDFSRFAGLRTMNARDNG